MPHTLADLDNGTLFNTPSLGKAHSERNGREDCNDLVPKKPGIKKVDVKENFKHEVASKIQFICLHTSITL